MNCPMCPPVRLTTHTASMTRAVPATLICHMRSTSRIPLRRGSRRKARWTTERAPLSRSNSMSCQQDASRPKSICSNRAIGRELSGGRMSTPTTRKSASNGSSLVPRFPPIPVTRTVRSGSILLRRRWRVLRRRVPGIRRRRSSCTRRRTARVCGRRNSRSRRLRHSSARVNYPRLHRTRRLFRAEIGIVQNRRHRALYLLDLVCDQLTLQGARDRSFGFAERDRANRDYLVDVEGCRIGKGLRNLARLQLEDRLVRLGKRTGTTRADIDVGWRSVDAGLLRSFLFQLLRVLAGNPTRPDLFDVSLLVSLGWLGLLGTTLVARKDDALQRHFQVLLAVLLVVILNLLVGWMRVLFGYAPVKRLRQDLVLGELHDLLHLGIVFHAHGASGVGKGQQLGILGRKAAHDVRRHRRPVRRRKCFDELLKLFARQAAHASWRWRGLAGALERENWLRHRHCIDIGCWRRGRGRSCGGCGRSGWILTTGSRGGRRRRLLLRSRILSVAGAAKDTRNRKRHQGRT